MLNVIKVIYRRRSDVLIDNFNSSQQITLAYTANFEHDY